MYISFFLILDGLILICKVIYLAYKAKYFLVENTRRCSNEGGSLEEKKENCPIKLQNVSSATVSLVLYNSD